MKGHKLAGEDARSYHVQGPDGKTFQVAKGPLDMKMHVAISRLPRAKAPDIAVPAPHLDQGGVPAPDAYSAGLSGYAGPDQSTTFQPSPTDSPLTKLLSGQIDMMGTPTPASAQIAGPPNTPGPMPVDAAPNQIPMQGAQNPPPAVPTQPNPGPSQMDPATGIFGDINSAIKQQQDANDKMAAAQAQQAQDAAKAYEAQQKAMADAQAAYQQKLAALDQENAKMTSDVAASRIDPNHYVDNLGTGGKILAVISAAIGGAGAGLSGQPNLAVGVIQDNIKRDIEAQKDNLGAKQSLLKMNLEKYGTLDRAYQATFLQQAAITQGQVNMAAARAGTPEAYARAQQLNGQLAMSMIPLKQSLAQWQMQQEFLKGPQGSAGPQTPEQENTRALVGGMLFPGKSEQINKEMGDHRKLQQDLAMVDAAYDPSSQDSIPQLTNWHQGVPGFTGERTAKLEASKTALRAAISKDSGGKENPSLFEALGPLIDSPIMEKPEASKFRAGKIKDLLIRNAQTPTLDTMRIVAPRTTTGQSAQAYPKAGP